ncbi:MAG: 1-acyl-sn-glycerol-3-phosphate acyltransferase [Spirochaetaceae bacterium]
MRVRKYIVNKFLKNTLGLICRVDDVDLSVIPLKGPLIICINHINFLDVPLTHVLLQPRDMIGFAKKETWDNPLLAFIFNTFDAIPVDRGKGNLSAFKNINKLLKEEKIICIAPEGTRSGDGVLLKGKPGVVPMALLSGAPLLPIVQYGGEKVWGNLKRFKRTKITYKIGRPFILKSEDKINSVVREKMMVSIMYQVSDLLPENLRGYYSDPAKKSTEYIEFIKTN